MAWPSTDAGESRVLDAPHIVANTQSELAEFCLEHGHLTASCQHLGLLESWRRRRVAGWISS